MHGFGPRPAEPDTPFTAYDANHRLATLMLHTLTHRAHMHMARDVDMQPPAARSILDDVRSDCNSIMCLLSSAWRGNVVLVAILSQRLALCTKIKPGVMTEAHDHLLLHNVRAYRLCASCNELCNGHAFIIVRRLL